MSLTIHAVLSTGADLMAAGVAPPGGAGTGAAGGGNSAAGGVGSVAGVVGGLIRTILANLMV